MAKNNPRIGATLVLSEGNFFTNLKKASSGIKDLKKNFDSNAASVKKHSSAISSAGDGIASLTKKVIGVAAAYVSIKKVTSVAKECIDKAKTAEQANVRLNTIMQQIPGITQEAKDGVAAYCKELSKQTSIGGTAQKMGASQLASFKMSADSVKKLMPSLNNLAVAQYGVSVSGDQMIQAANMLGKAYSGQTGALTRAGVVLSDTQAKIIKNGTDAQKTAALVEVLTQNFGDLAGQMANTKEGQLVRIQNAIGGIKTTIGNSLLPVVATVTEYVAEKLPTIQSAVESATGKISPYIQSAVSGIKPVFDKVINAVAAVKPEAENLWSVIKNGAASAGNVILWLIDNWNSLSPVIYGVVGAIGAYNVITGIKNGLTAISVATTGLEAEAFAGLSISQLAAVSSAGLLVSVQTALNAAFIASPIGWIVVGIGLVIAAVVLLYKKCSWFRDFVNKMFKSVVDWAKSTWSEIKSSLAPLVAAVKGAFSEALGAIKAFWNIVKPYFVMGWNNIKAILSVVSVHFKGLFGILGAYIKARIKMAVALFTAVWNTIRGIFSVVKSVLTGDWQGAWEGIKGIVGTWGAYFRTVWEGIKSVFGAAWKAIKAIFGKPGNWFKDNVISPIASLFGAINEWLNTYIVQPVKRVITAIYNIIAPIFSKIWEIYSKIWEIITTLLGRAWEWFNTNVVHPIANVFLTVKNTVFEVFRSIWNKLVEIFSSLWTKATEIFHSIWDTLVEIFTPVANWFSSVFSAVKDAICNAFKAAADFVKSVWDGIVSVIKGAINGVIKGVNAMLRGAVNGINLLIDGVNAVAGTLGLSLITKLDAPQIPMLAKGGVIQRAGNVIVGERGPEMLRLPRGASVTPLPAGMAAGGGTYNNTFYVTVNADDSNSAERFVRRVKEILDNM